MSRRDGAQPLFDVATDPPDVREQAPPDQFLEHAERGAAREQIPAVGAAVIAERDRPRDLFADERRADRYTASECFANRYELRLQADGGGIEGISGAAQSALHFVGNQERAGPTAGLHNRPRIRGRQRAYAAFALNRFDDDGGSRSRCGGAYRRRVVRWNESDA